MRKDCLVSDGLGGRDTADCFLHGPFDPASHRCPHPDHGRASDTAAQQEGARTELLAWAKELNEMPHHSRCSSRIPSGENPRSVGPCDCYRSTRPEYARAREIVALAAEVARLHHTLAQLRERAEKEPLEVDVSDYSDEWCAGFLAGQTNALDLAAQTLDQRGGNR